MGASKAQAIVTTFFHEVWRDHYLNDRNEDYIALAVPFAEKDQAKALGAKWDWEGKVWQVEKQDDMTPFSRWLPQASDPEDITRLLMPIIPEETCQPAARSLVIGPNESLGSADRKDKIPSISAWRSP